MVATASPDGMLVTLCLFEAASINRSVTFLPFRAGMVYRRRSRAFPYAIHSDVRVVTRIKKHTCMTLHGQGK